MSIGGKLRVGLIAGVSASALIAPSAYAQDANVIEELVVTAQKREESLQDVPIAVSAFNQESLDRQQIDGGQNLQQAIPNVTFSRTNGGGFNFVIRGIGSKTGTVTGDAATGIHLNNAPLTTNTLADADFYDVERVEVLRGPQGTLFGRNATGGVVNIITAKPNPDFGAEARMEIGNYNSAKFRGMINVPVTEDLALRVAGIYSRRDGFGDNIITGTDVDDRDLYALRGTVSWNPTDRLSTYFIWDGGDRPTSFCLQDRGRGFDPRCQRTGTPTRASATASVRRMRAAPAREPSARRRA